MNALNSSRENGALLIKNNPIQIFIQAELALFISIEGQVMALIHLFIFQAKLVSRACSNIMIPAIREQDAAYIQE